MFFLLLLCGLVLADPVVVPPNNFWDGNDGPWSTFSVQVGTPPQVVRVLPSTSGSLLWAVVPDGCTTAEPTACPELRGGLFDNSASSTWVEKGLFTLDLTSTSNWGYDGNGQFGYDTITLSNPGGGGPTLNRSILAGIATKDFFLGQLGLAPWGVNFTDYNNPIPGVLQTLRNSTIDSSSWAYTAGAYWTPKQNYGSLIFGGYDTSRFDNTSTLTITRGEDTSRDLLVGIQSITTGTKSLLPKGIIAMIDSTIPEIWLPLEACQKFEENFGLVWNDTVDRYLVNETHHSELVNNNPIIKFTLGLSATSRDIININMPYGAFDLNLRWPYSESRYFPLRRAANASQYLLGRAFLQSAYLIVDYDRNNFTLAPALYPEPGVAANVVTILSPQNISKTTSTHPIGTAAIIGIVVGGIVLLILVVTGICMWRRRKASQKSKDFKNDPTIAESRNMLGNELDGQSLSPQSELESKFGSNRSELEGRLTFGRPELENLSAYQGTTSKLGNGRYQVYEKGGDQPVVYELAGSDVSEMEARSTPQTVSGGLRSPGLVSVSESGDSTWGRSPISLPSQSNIS